MLHESMDDVLSCRIMIITHVRPRRGHKYEFDMDFSTNEIFRHMFFIVKDADACKHVSTN